MTDPTMVPDELTGDSLGRRSVRGGMAFIASRGAVDGVRLVSILVLARLLEPSEFGVVALVVAVVGIAEVLQDFGFSTASVQRPDLTDQQASTLLWINVTLATVLTAAVVGLAPTIARLLRNDVADLIVLLAPMFVISALSSQHLANLQRSLRFGTIASIRLVKVVAYAGVTISMASAGFGRSSLVWGLLVSTAVETVMATVSSPLRVGRPRIEPAIREILRFGGGLLGYSLLNYGAGAIPTLAIGRVHGAVATGVFGRAQRLIGLTSGYLITPLGSVVFPVMARLVAEPGRWQRYYYRVQGIVALPTLGVCTLLAAHTTLVVDVVLGPGWDDVGPIMFWLAIATMSSVPCIPTGWALVSLGRGDRLLRWGLVGYPIVLVGALVGLPGGPEGVAAGFAAGSVLLIWPCLRFAFRDTPLSVHEALRSAVRPFPAALLATVASLLTADLFESSPVTLRLIAVGIVHLATYTVVVLSSASQRELLRTVLRRMRPEDQPETPRS